MMTISAGWHRLVTLNNPHRLCYDSDVSSVSLLQASGINCLSSVGSSLSLSFRVLNSLLRGPASVSLSLSISVSLYLPLSLYLSLFFSLSLFTSSFLIPDSVSQDLHLFGSLAFSHIISFSLSLYLFLSFSRSECLYPWSVSSSLSLSLPLFLFHSISVLTPTLASRAIDASAI